MPRLTDPASRIARLLDYANRKYAAPHEGSWWLVAVPAEPSGTTIKKCEADDPRCWLVDEGCVNLPFASLIGFGSAAVERKGHYQLLGIAPAGVSPDESFKTFAAYAGATLIASPPRWLPDPITQGTAANAWVASLFFGAPAAPRLVSKLGDCLVLTGLWAASLIALRDWQHTVEQEARPRASNGPMSVAKADCKARELTDTPKKKKEFFALSETKQAKRIGCSWATWSKTGYFEEAMAQGWLPHRKKAESGTIGGSPSVVSLTSDLEATIGAGDPKDIVNQLADAEVGHARWEELPPEERRALLAQHEAEAAADPSPLESRPMKVRTQKHL
jgi:hypothetical protein